MADPWLCTASRLTVVDAWLVSKCYVAVPEERVGYIKVSTEPFHFHMPNSNTFHCFSHL